MLLKLRGGLDSLFVTALLGVLIAAFAIWGIGPSFLSSSSQNVAVVGETKVPTDQYATVVQRRAEQIQQQFGGQYSADQIIRMMNLDMQVLNQMVTEAAVTEKMRELGLRGTDDQVIEELHKLEAFKLPDGSFSKEMMREALSQARITEKELLTDLRKSVTRVQLLDSMSLGAMVPRSLAEKLHVWQGERRRASMINFPASEITDIAAPTDEELQAAYEANAQSYMTPERRSYRYILLTPEQFTDAVDVTEDDIEAAYHNRIDEFSQAELRNLMLVTFDSKDAADTFIADVANGADFVAAATAATSFAPDELNIGDQTREDLVTDFDAQTADAVFGADTGAIVGPLEGVAGWNVFKVSSVTAGASKSLEDVRDELVSNLKHELAIDHMFDFLPEIEDSLYAEGGLEGVAAKLNLQLATVTDIDHDGKGTDGRSLVTQQSEYIIMSDAFSSELGHEVALKDLDPGDNTLGSYVMELTAIHAPEQKSFEDVKGDVRTAWENQKKMEKAGELAEQAKERLNAGASAESIVADLGGTSFEAKNVARTGSASSNMSPSIRRLMFDLDLGAADYDRAADDNGYVVVRVEEVVPGDPTTQAGAVDAIYAQLQKQFDDELFIQYQNYLLEQYEPEINMPVVQRLFRNDSNQ